MKPHDQPHGLCSVDPISLGAMAIGGLASMAMSGGGSGTNSMMSSVASSLSPKDTPIAPPTQAEAAPPAQAPVGGKPNPKSQTSTFLGTGAAAAPQQTASKTLLGQ